MVVPSAVLYFIAHHPGLTTLALTGIGLGVGALLAIWRRQALWCGLVIPFFLLSSISYFIVPFANALFLNAFGTGPRCKPSSEDIVMMLIWISSRNMRTG
jgi:hypothetical protein